MTFAPRTVPGNCSSLWRLTIGALLMAAVLLFTTCAHVGEQEMDVLYQQDVVNRKQAKEMLRMGVRINITVCPENTTAGYYAIQATIPEELNFPHYSGEAISTCSLLLAVAPCGLNPDGFQPLLLNFYNALLQTCDLDGVGF